MARIRTIKPEFWDSASVGEASLRARLLFIAMWNWADDYGIGDATPIRLIGFAFPNDGVGVADFPPLREEISERFGVVFYKHEGRPYFHIPSWEKHQRTEKRAQQRIPFPHDIENVEMTDISISVAESPTLSSGNADAGTGEQGKKEEGTGEEGRSLSRKPSAIEDEDFDTFWDVYDHKRGKKLAQQRFKTALKKPGVTAERLISAAADYIAWQKREGKYPTYTKDPASWLNGEHWEDERSNAPVVPLSKPSTTDQRVNAAMALAQQVRERQQNTDQPRAIGSNR